MLLRPFLSSSPVLYFVNLSSELFAMDVSTGGIQILSLRSLNSLSAPGASQTNLALWSHHASLWVLWLLFAKHAKVVGSKTPSWYHVLELVLVLIESYLRIVADHRFRIDQLLGNFEVLPTDLSLLLQPFLGLKVSHWWSQVRQKRVHIVLIGLRIVLLGESEPRVANESRDEMPTLADGVNSLS